MQKSDSCSVGDSISRLCKLLIATMLLTGALMTIRYMLPTRMEHHGGIAEQTCGNQTTSPANTNPLDEFIQTRKDSREIIETQNVCLGKHVRERVLQTTQVDVTSRAEDPSFRLPYPFTPEGVMAVIQEINFGVDNSSQCVDFVQFSKPDGTNKSPTTCGYYVQSTPPIVNNVFGPMSYISDDLSIRVKHSLYVEGTYNAKHLEKSLKVKFTNYYACPDTTDASDLLEKSILKRCNPTIALSCIPAELFCDGINHCADFGEGIGFDEKNCDPEDMTINSLDLSSQFNLKTEKPVNVQKDSKLDLAIAMLFVILPTLIIVGCMLVYFLLLKHKNRELNDAFYKRALSFLSNWTLSVQEHGKIIARRNDNSVVIDKHGQVIAVDPIGVSVVPHDLAQILLAIQADEEAKESSDSDIPEWKY